MKNFLLIMLLIGSVVGAGFASGRELTALFVYPIPLYVAPLIGLGIFLCSFLFLTISNKLSPINVSTLNKQMLGKCYPLADAFLLFNSLAVLAGMLSGMDTLLNEILPISPAYSILSGILCILVVSKGIKGLIKGNLFLVPIITIAIIIITSLSINLPIKLQSLTVKNIPSMLIYVSMNMMLASTVYTSIYPQKAKQRLICCLISSIIITILLFLIILSLNSTRTQAPMPLIKMAQNVSPTLYYISVICIALAIFSTMASAMNGLNNWLSSLIGQSKYTTILVLISGLIVSNLGFENIVSYVYPIIGIFGIIYIALSGIFVIFIHSKKLSRLAKSFKPLFNHGNTKIHNASKYTQNNSRSHNQI